MTLIAAGDCVVWLTLSDPSCWYILRPRYTHFIWRFPCQDITLGAKLQICQRSHSNWIQTDQWPTVERGRSQASSDWSCLEHFYINQTDTYPEDSNCEFDLFDVYLVPWWILIHLINTHCSQVMIVRLQTQPSKHSHDLNFHTNFVDNCIWNIFLQLIVCNYSLHFIVATADTNIFYSCSTARVSWALVQILSLRQGGSHHIQEFIFYWNCNCCVALAYP